VVDTGSLPLKNDVQLVTQFPQSRRQALDVLSAAESVLPISYSEVTCGPMTRPATLNSSATSSSNSTDFSSSSSSSRSTLLQAAAQRYYCRRVFPACPANSYKSSAGRAPCVACPQDQFTPHNASTSPHDCRCGNSSSCGAGESCTSHCQFIAHPPRP